ncbi:MAG: hypothetical protein FD119_132 [Stygiobacter sp.]|nr:MAG: hypothetical protein FD119_132 [Stygiobacter sp.]
MDLPEDAISKIFVETRRVKTAIQRLTWLKGPDGYEKDYCLAAGILGPPRTGKTRIAKHFKAICEKGRPATAVPPIVYVEVTSGCSPKSVSTDVLAQLGDPNPDYGTLAEKCNRAEDAIRRHSVELIMLDEVHRLVDTDTRKVKRDVATWFTDLLNRRACPMAFLGETSAERIFEHNDYADGRTLGVVYVTPYDWGNQEDRKEFREIMQAIDANLGMPEQSGLHEVATALRIYNFGRGLLGQCTRLIKVARMLARDQSRPCLTHDIFADTVDALRIGVARNLPNPFRLTNPAPLPSASMHAEEEAPAEVKEKPKAKPGKKAV